MAELENYFVDVANLSFNEEITFDALKDRWFYISVKVPDLSGNDVIKLQGELGKLSMFLLAPAMLNHCKNRMGIFEGPIPFIESFDKLKKHGPTTADFEMVFDSNLFHFRTYWITLTELIKNYIQNTALLNPIAILFDVSVPGIEPFAKWMRNLEEVYAYVQIPSYEVQFKLTTTTQFTKTNRHGIPQSILSGVGLFKTPQKDILVKSYYQCMATNIDMRLRFNLAKRKTPRRQYLM